MPLIILVPILFAILGAIVSYAVARWQNLHGRALVAAVVGGVIGGALGGVLTVPVLGLGATVAAATAATGVSEGAAGAVGFATEYGALAVAQGVGSGVGQASSNVVNHEPLRKDVGFATFAGGASQVVLTPVGDKVALALTPIVPVAARTIGVALANAKGAAPAAVKGALGALGGKWGGETATEALTDGATMVVPPPGEKKPDEPEKGMTGALGDALGR